MFTNMFAFLGKGIANIVKPKALNQQAFLLFRAVASHKGN